MERDVFWPLGRRADRQRPPRAESLLLFDPFWGRGSKTRTFAGRPDFYFRSKIRRKRMRISFENKCGFANFSSANSRFLPNSLRNAGRRIFEIHGELSNGQRISLQKFGGRKNVRNKFGGMFWLRAFGDQSRGGFDVERNSKPVRSKNSNRLGISVATRRPTRAGVL